MRRQWPRNGDAARRAEADREILDDESSASLRREIRVDESAKSERFSNRDSASVRLNAPLNRPFGRVAHALVKGPRVNRRL